MSAFIINIISLALQDRLLAIAQSNVYKSLMRSIILNWTFDFINAMC